jgi:hypothetical protein
MWRIPWEKRVNELVPRSANEFDVAVT